VSAAVPLPERVVLFDGDCGLCSRVVRRLLAADARGVLRFAPLQGATAETVRRAHPEIPAHLDSLLLVERDAAGERVAWRTDAVVRIARALGGRWRALAWLLDVVPRTLADAGYDAVARRRHRVAPAAGCPLPTPAERARFLP